MTQARIALGAVACGTAAAAILPGHRLGLGVVVIGVAMGAVVALARPARPSFHSALSGTLALVLLSVALWRDAGWIVGLDLVAAACLFSLAIAGGKKWRDIVRGGGAAGTALLRGLSFVLAPARALGGGSLRHRAPALLRGLALSAVLLGVFGGLFASADRAFLELANDVLMPEVEGSLLAARIYLVVFVTALTGAYVVIGPRYAAATVDDGSDVFGPQQRRPFGLADWSISLGLLNALFAGFVIVQMTVLFGGRHHVLDTVGLGYAEYAREGFFQLVAVAALVMCVIAGAVRWARADTRSQRILLRLLLGLLCVLTLVVLASALRRLTLYEDTYGFTRLRISVHAVILWLGVLFGMILVAGALWRANWLPRAFVYVTAGSLVLFSVINPEGLIARQNVERFAETGSIDTYYLRSLSADAVPGLSGLPSNMRACLFKEMSGHLGLDGWASFNLARHEAAQVVSRAGQPIDDLCPLTLTGRV